MGLAMIGIGWDNQLGMPDFWIFGCFLVILRYLSIPRRLAIISKPFFHQTSRDILNRRDLTKKKKNYFLAFFSRSVYENLFKTGF